MSSLWKDLLFLHGHLTHAQLIWSDVEETTNQDAATTNKPRPDALKCGVACCAVTTALPRIAAPR
ncbi:hypothetical protein ASD22_10635 [Rhodanobacter sp. Root480]|jgi:hypothetical protein|uniref:Uncharacterized protein n=1 Tax=Rhodanobacter ginsenosidimutans TaxID=490571 RepID=A0ABW0JSU2_9GAMM|nr:MULTISPECIES: hypothetical protein [unclassified Rhodanobacter]KQX97674.1 hypothetical protein ASD22_10635 [Rhodanobacter sp. Root480]KRA33468.1 hypothetical protein ASD68_10800 [Rhodanobacter sp. Root627]